MQLHSYEENAWKTNIRNAKYIKKYFKIMNKITIIKRKCLKKMFKYKVLLLTQ